jgi:nitrile hydratase subunit beta
MGGMHGMGPIVYEKNEPVFHARWEARVLAMLGAMGATGKLRGFGRAALERIPPAEYLRMSYYERFFTVLVQSLVGSGLVTPDEVRTGKAARGSPKAVPALNAAEAASRPLQPRTVPNVRAEPRFQVGQRVRARNIHPEGHTRLPRYARGRAGIIERDYGPSLLPDTPNKPQHVYAVCFAARELWGEEASPRDSVCIDMWDDYLEPA